MTTIEERAPRTDTPVADVLVEHLDWLKEHGRTLGELGRRLELVERQWLDFAATVRGDIAGSDGPPAGCALKTEYVRADELLLGDRAVPAGRQVVGPVKDAYRHFGRVDATGSLKDGQVVVGWRGGELVVSGDDGWVRVRSGRVVVEAADGLEAFYEWEQGR